MTQATAGYKIIPKNSAIHRKPPSPVIRYLIQNKYLDKDQKILDYGCGYGEDANFLSYLGFAVTKYDPYYFPQEPIGNFDTVLCLFVLNVIPDFCYRQEILKRIVYPFGRCFIAVRNEINGYSHVPYLDGYYSKNKCVFNKPYTESEFIDLLSGYKTKLLQNTNTYLLAQVEECCT